MKYVNLVLVVVALFLSQQSSAFETEHDHSHHSRVGYHGMVLVTDGVDLYASHLPLYRSPHDFQLLYKIESRFKNELVARLTAHAESSTYLDNMVTLLPAKFDLNKLVAGETFAIETQFYTGHFERGGKKWLKDLNLKFVRQIYKRPLANIVQGDKSSAMVWELIKGSDHNKQIWIHHISARPSMDAIVLGTDCIKQQNQIEHPAITQLTYAALLSALQASTSGFSQCKSKQILYFETQDFAL